MLFIVRSLVLVLALAVSPSARAQTDPWFGPDKALHFGASAALSSGGYAAGRLLLEERSDALLFGAGLALGAGVAKELADFAGLGTPSFRDLTWDAIGTLTGLLVALALDELVGWWLQAPVSAASSG